MKPAALAAALAAALLLTACAGRAPDLPSQAPLSQQQFAAYQAMDCDAIAQKYNLATEGLRRIEEQNAAQHGKNQGTLYIAGFFPPIYMFSVPNKPFDEQVADLVKSRDRLGAAYRMKGCGIKA